MTVPDIQFSPPEMTTYQYRVDIQYDETVGRYSGVGVDYAGPCTEGETVEECLDNLRSLFALFKAMGWLRTWESIGPPEPDRPSFLHRVYVVCVDQNDVLDALVDTFDEYMIAERWDAANAAIRSLDIESMRAAEVLCVVGLTAAAREHLPARAELVDRAVAKYGSANPSLLEVM